MRRSVSTETTPVADPATVVEEPSSAPKVEAKEERMPVEPAVRTVESKPVETPKVLKIPKVQPEAVTVATRKASATLNKRVYGAKPVVTRGRSSRRPPKI